MFYSSFGILSLIVYIIINYGILITKKAKKETEALKLYRRFLYSVICYFVVDIIWGLLYDARITALIYIDTELYFIIMALSVMLWTTAVVEFLGNKNVSSLILRMSGHIIFFIVLFCVLANMFFPIVFSFGPDGEYRPQRIRYAFLGTQVLLFAFTAIYTFYTSYKRSGKARHNHRTIAISGTVMTVFIILQTFFPFLPFYSVGCLLASSLIHTFVSVQAEHERNRILEEALEDARRANEAKTVFLSHMSHAIRTPINAILGMNEIIRRDSSDNRILSCADKIQKAGTSLLGIISDILDFSKIEAGKMELYFEDYSVRNLLSDIYNLTCYRAESKGIGLIFNIDPKLPQKLNGDELRIKQVITNLLTNAVKYTEKGEVALKIAMQEGTREYAHLRVCVSDTGIGISKEDLEKLFEAFNRLDTKRTRTIEGTGLGLSISSNLLQMMGTKLCVESTYNVGSDFYFDIEQKIVDDTPIGDEWQNDKASDKDTLSDKPRYFTSPESRILLVDDTALNIEVICGLLEPTKVQIDTALSGEECIEKFAQNLYDFVFLDYLMPRMDGIETLSKIKELYPEKADKTPIVSLTANAVSGERERMLGAGFTDYMTKPVIVSELMEMLIKYLPKEKVQIEEYSEDVNDKSPSENLPDKLLAIPWINVEEAIEYCGTSELYLSALELFSGVIDDKAALLENCLATGDIELFVVTVHALKSSFRTMGIADFSERARELEFAGRNNDLELINSKFPDFIRDYRELKTILQDAIAV